MGDLLPLTAFSGQSAFTYESRPGRVVFGVGSISQLAEEFDRLNVRRALVLCTARQSAVIEALLTPLRSRIAGTFSNVLMHVPAETAEEARREASRLGADCCLAIGGGSAIGLGKAIALVSSLPIIAVPTSYAGSEMTPIYGITEAGRKNTGRDERVRPRVVIYDAVLTLSLPPQLSAYSGLNAIAHAVEALYAVNASPIITLMAQEAISALARALPTVVSDPGDLDARSDALYGAWLAGSVLGAVNMGLHHKLCHALGGSLGLPHAQTHAVMLPFVAAYNAAFASDAMQRVARALQTDAGPSGLYELGRALGVPRSLAELGMMHGDLDRAADVISFEPYPNPRPVERRALRALLQNAFDGVYPPSLD